MAAIKKTLTEEALKTLTPARLKKSYLELATFYNAIFTERIRVYCHKCDTVSSHYNFYHDNRYKSGFYPICKKCLLSMATDYDSDTGVYTDNHEKTLDVLRMMDLPYIDKIYREYTKIIREDNKERTYSTAFQQLMVVIKSFPQYSGKTWKDSEFGTHAELENDNKDRKPRPEIKKLFGSGFSNDDYLYLQDAYDDWCARTTIDGKSQEIYITRICFKLLDIWKAQKAGKDTKDLDKSLNDLMSAANLQPKQSVANSSSDNLTFGQMIEKWELEEPVPEPKPEFKDVDGIGKYIRVFFKGHLAKALSLENGYSREYDDYIKEYTVDKLQYQEDEQDTTDYYEYIFGKDGD